MSDFIFTLDSDPEDKAGPSTATRNPKQKTKRVRSKIAPPVPKDDELGALDPSFNFDVGGGLSETWDLGPQADEVTKGTKPVPISVDDIIERRRATGTSQKIKPLKRKRDPAEHVSEDSENDEDGVQELGSDDESEAFGGAAEDDENKIPNDEDPLNSSDEEDNEEESEEGEEDENDTTLHSDGDSDSDEETQAEKDRKAAYFADPAAHPKSSTPSSSFANMNLSRPIVRALTTLSFNSPTPIQASTIPVALEGHDVLGSAVTGSGKTAAFLIPAMERLMYRQRGGTGEIRVLVLVPTRELAVQCADVGKSLARFTDVSFGVIVGGLSNKAQEATLRSRPDILIATPGRLIDHLQNTPSFTLSAIDILVLDEADRMLSDGFAAELSEIISACPKSRQTMLFSATMTDDVDSLVRLSMNRPVRLFVDPKKTIARGLVQEFVRVRRESDREAMLVVLCGRTAKTRTIVFFRSKKLCHQMRVVFGVLGLKAAELHGDLTQDQRLTSLRQFRDGQVDYLLATDVASRGLDIKGTETVINYDMPSQIELYMHRVGRTARAGEQGRSISLVGEADRAMVKVAMKRSEGDKVLHRVVPPESVKKMVERLEAVREEVKEVLKEEVEEKAIRRAEMELRKGVNMIEHQDEIFSRPKKTWFTSGKEKAAAESLSKAEYEATIDPSKLKSLKSGKDTSSAPAPPKRDKFSGLSRRAKRRKLAAEADKEYNDTGAVNASIRAAKKAERPVKIGDYVPSMDKKGKGKGKDKGKGKHSAGKSVKSKVLGKTSFDREIGGKGGKGGAVSREGVRSKKSDSGILSGKKGGGGGGKGKAGGGKGKGRR